MDPRCHCCGRIARVAGSFRWLLPGAVLVCMPKCPACFAAYVALASGIGISLPVAAFVRTALIEVCVASLGYWFFRRLRLRGKF